MIIQTRLLDRWSIKKPGQTVILDNRDSFVYNLAHRCAEVGMVSAVMRSDEITLDELILLEPSALIISPGPGHPQDAGISEAAIQYFSGKIPILGVCLGHQAIGTSFGGRVSMNGTPVHGKSSDITHCGESIFEGLQNPLPVGRYHSLVIQQPLPDELECMAWGDNYVMAVRHREHLTFGVQFHPESVLTADGLQLLANFIRLIEVQ